MVVMSERMKGKLGDGRGRDGGSIEKREGGVGTDGDWTRLYMFNVGQGHAFNLRMTI